MGRELGLLLLLLGVSLGLWDGSRASLSLEGGASTFGYDAASSCSKPYSRTARARLELPCNLRHENLCTIAGSDYPWEAVRRFVQENQGLMRRMYGDEKHISVLKTELGKNDVELELENDAGQFYYDDSSPLYRQFQLEDDNEFDQDLVLKEALQSDRELYGRSLNSGSSGKLGKTEAEAPARRHSHPNETPTVVADAHEGASAASGSSTASPTTSTPGIVSSTTSSGTTITSSTSTASALETTTTGRQTTSAGNSTTSSATTTTTKTTTTSSTTQQQPLVVNLDQLAKVQNLSANEIAAGQIDRLDVDVEELVEVTETADLDTTLQPNASDAPYPERDKFYGAEDADTSESQLRPQQFRPRPEYRPAEPVATATAATTPAAAATGGSLEGQLYQAVAAKDKQEQPVLKVRGINACPVKEEVVAPFWANNTRGEILALLNLYPFEQYVHWEKCTHENKQMYCRDGCRCEQQYRLHRLLAYDPNNECRGIFSDWFKFPSCCICRCYDLPLEFRVTSRSPRLASQQQTRKLRVRAPRKPPRQRRN